MISDVQEFNAKFGLPLGDEDVLSSDVHAVEYRRKFLQEELDEFSDAMFTGNRVEAFDALLDLVYVAYGTALFLGIRPLQWYSGFSEVHACNMAKERVEKATDSKRGSTFDCRKPEGWVGPEAKLADILGWEKP